MDQFDTRILRELRQNARIPLNELASKVGLSPTPVGRRLRLLEERGLIEGYTVLLNEAALGFGISVFVSVQLDRQVDEALTIFETAIQSFPEVVDCWLMTGNRDYLLRIVTTDLVAFEKFLVGKLTKISGVASIESSIPLRRVKTGISRFA
ncbi:MAG: Lrp/AsnC family transcriptional regulator [Pseudomonadota bacterium]